MNESPLLNPCPECGGEATYAGIFLHDVVEYSVECTECPTTLNQLFVPGTDIYKMRQQVASIWNAPKEGERDE